MDDNPNVRYDLGGWISGPCLDWPVMDDPSVIASEFPGWEAWQGVDRRWHARIRGATPPVMVHDDDLVGLREEIVRMVSQIEQEACRRQDA